uniref:Uncharacterized protein n=1 Tax=Arundo donax TaxID=35708 RepID=A0A0A9FH53_ARUDO
MSRRQSRRKKNVSDAYT